MNTLFRKYLVIGIINTAIHWVIFCILFYVFINNQALANFGAFCFAVTFSFFANAKWTFTTEATTIRYVLYVLFMGGVASLVGWASDKCTLPPLVTLICFSIISLVVGFTYSKLIVFRDVK
ncbi:putative flippase GtrA [Pantoea sp. PA1]|jgi:putative flippase GtrA|uniref:GtrA family protein n=1 Tax=Pantoea ananas TaxID=553 RepID=UPI000CF4B394|nr:GtrA family protein [Pantoea ananatis]MDH0052969.1 GtrA family protein [Pantoea ananatis]PQL04501.1 translocase [Pantoea ananatis]